LKKQSIKKIKYIYIYIYIYIFEKNKNQIWHKNKIKSNHERWNWKIIPIKKRIWKNTNNNQKNEETWCKSQKSRDEIENHNQQRIQVKCIEIKIMMT
jgi:hypothetical protein